jgi:putative transposase
LTLYWVEQDDGELVPASKKSKDSKEVEVEEEYLRMSRQLVKQARKLISIPELSKVNTMTLDVKVAILEEGKNSFPYWLKIATLQKGKPIYLPLKKNPFFEQQKSKGQLKKFVQLSITDKGKITISPVIEQADAEERTKGKSVGLDWGVTVLFATSEGQLLGKKMLNSLKVWDDILIELQAELQRKQLKLKENAYYRELQQRITEYVKNEVGRVLNKIATEEIREIIVEKLNFRNGGLSRQMNRIVTRAGRRAVEAKLKRLQEEKGIVISHVNAAYSSRQCSSCGYVSSKNRKSQSEFKCECCGQLMNADVNAARNIKERRSFFKRLFAENGKGRKNLLSELQERHRLRCPTGKHLATVSL